MGQNVSNQIDIPQTDGRRIIFPINHSTVKYETNYLHPALTDNHCQFSDINSLLDSIYKQTRDLAVFRKKKIWNYALITLFYLFWLLGCSCLIYGGNNGNVLVFCLGIYVMIGSWIIIYFFSKTYDNGIFIRDIIISFLKVQQILESQKQLFKDMGLRWRCPLNCCWLELWMEFRFQPNFLANALPPQQVIPVHIQQLLMQQNANLGANP